MENITFNEQINLFLENKDQGNLRPTHARINLCMRPWRMCMQAQTCARMADSRNYERKVFFFKIEFWKESHIVWKSFKPLFSYYK